MWGYGIFRYTVNVDDVSGGIGILWRCWIYTMMMAAAKARKNYVSKTIMMKNALVVNYV